LKFQISGFHSPAAERGPLERLASQWAAAETGWEDFAEMGSVATVETDSGRRAGPQWTASSVELSLSASPPSAHFSLGPLWAGAVLPMGSASLLRVRRSPSTKQA
jgi:hypothetical protein